MIMKTLNVHGIVVPIRSNEVSPEIWAALQSGCYEANEATRVPRAVRPGDRVLELGAGIGVITSIVAAIEAVRVWSFEADPRTARLAQRVIDLNCHGNVILANGILAAGPPSKVTFYRRVDFWMSSKFPEQGPYEGELELESVDIDEFIEEHGINVVVMDVEGAELDILQRARLPGVERVFLSSTTICMVSRACRKSQKQWRARGSSMIPELQADHVFFTRSTTERGNSTRG